MARDRKRRRADRHAVRGADALELGPGPLGGTFTCLRRARELFLRELRRRGESTSLVV